MHRKILVTCLSVHWTAFFALGAMAAIPAEGGADIEAAAFATGHALVAVLFLWTSFCVWSGDGEATRQASGLALGVAALVLAASAATGAAGSGVAMQLAGMGVTYLVVRSLEHDRETEPPQADWSGEVARRLALAAAHGSMLSRLSGRGREERDA